MVLRSAAFDRKGTTLLLIEWGRKDRIIHRTYSYCRYNILYALTGEEAVCCFVVTRR